MGLILGYDHCASCKPIFKPHYMKRFLPLISILVIISCISRIEKNTSSGDLNKSNSLNKNQVTPDPDVALKFINDYTKQCNDGTFNETWIEQNQLLTEKFKKSYNKLLDSARKEDPEFGLGFDPIMDAQDFPDMGFELMKCDSLGYVTIKGLDLADFILILKIVHQDDKWLVDGCGIINIPADKRARR